MDNSIATFINKAKGISFVLISVLILWLGWLLISGNGPDSEGGHTWSSAYQIIAWLGAICGIYFSKLWGGWKSMIGRANLVLAIGLLLQSLGQSVFSIYFFMGIEVPYPSIADIGFFGSVPVYVYGIYLLAKASGAKISLREYKGKMIVLLIPALIISLSYYFFLREYELEGLSPLVIFLDLGYPFGQAIYVSMAIATYLLTKNFLGGLMKFPVLLFIGALSVQFIADYAFLYQVSRGIYIGGFEIDFLYMLAYFIMTYSLIKLAETFYKVQKS